MFSYFQTYDEAEKLGLEGNDYQMYVQLRADRDWLINNSCVANAKSVADRVTWIMNTLAWADEVRQEMMSLLGLTHEIMCKAYESKAGQWDFIPLAA